MNATENLVEQYYRGKGCFTSTDIKLAGGNNRQFDILASQVAEREFYHIEVSVTHAPGWQSTLDALASAFKQKFFGYPKNSRPDNPNTDYNKGKRYLSPIVAKYREYGIPFDQVKRVFCIWSCDRFQDADIAAWKSRLAEEVMTDYASEGIVVLPDNLQILSFRDEVLHRLMEGIGTAHYDNPILRFASLIDQYNKQRKPVVKTTQPSPL